MQKVISKIKGTGIRKELLLFFLLISFVAFANGLSDSILGNFFKEVYNVDEVQRAFIEFPRELPGLLCVFVIAALSFIGDIRIACIAQVLACIGILALGIFSPSYTVMLILLFVYSMGMHLFMPLSDSIGMSIAEKDKLGLRVGQYGTVKTAVAFATALLVFIGFKFGFFSFGTNVIAPFIISGIGFACAAIVGLLLVSAMKQKNISFKKTKMSFVFRKEYKLYYALTILNGVQKQIAYVFGSWVIIDLLLKGADTMSLLTIAASFLGMFFFRYVGKWIDTKGIKFMLFLDALSFIFVYIIYGIAVWLIVDNVVPDSTFMVMIVYVLFVLDRLSMQVGIIKSVYLRSIALCPEDVTKALSTGISLDHIVAIIAAQISGLIWANFGPQWVFFFAAFFSIGNLIVAFKVKEVKRG